MDDVNFVFEPVKVDEDSAKNHISIAIIEGDWINCETQPLCNCYSRFGMGGGCATVYTKTFTIEEVKAEIDRPYNDICKKCIRTFQKRYMKDEKE